MIQSRMAKGHPTLKETRIYQRGSRRPLQYQTYISISISRKKGKAVREYLITEGIIVLDRLSTIGYDETNTAM
jgi:outer membrane protein OmpA-like peptidoglycan-associated protein